MTRRCQDLRRSRSVAAVGLEGKLSVVLSVVKDVDVDVVVDMGAVAAVRVLVSVMVDVLNTSSVSVGRSPHSPACAGPLRHSSVVKS